MEGCETLEAVNVLILLGGRGLEVPLHRLPGIHRGTIHHRNSIRQTCGDRYMPLLAALLSVLLYLGDWKKDLP